MTWQGKKFGWAELIKAIQSEIGINVTKVVCNGYVAPPAIQDMQIQSLETQTKLSIQYEEEKQKQVRIAL